MDSLPPDLPDDLDALRAVAAAALAQNADDAATIARQNLEIAKLKRQITADDRWVSHPIAPFMYSPLPNCAWENKLTD